MTRWTVSRRLFLAGSVSVVTAGATAGCLGENGEADSVEDDDGAEPEPDPGLVVNGRVLSSAAPIELVDPSFDEPEGHAFGDPLIANVHWHGEDFSHWHFMPLEVPVGGALVVRVRFVDVDRRALDIGDGGEFQIEVELVEEDPARFVGVSVEDDLVTFTGQEPGAGGVVFSLLQDGDPVWSSDPADVIVPDEDG